VTAAELQAGLQSLTDISTALSAQLSNLPADEAVLGDAIEIAGLIDPAIVPFEVLLPVAEFLIVWLVANNKLHQQRMLPTDRRGQGNG
jgi:hypothetical protein